MAGEEWQVDEIDAQGFLSGGRIAVLGASDDPRSFARMIYTELRSRGYEVVAVNPNATTVAGDPSYPDVASAPALIDRAIVMVDREKAVGVVRECIDNGVSFVWLFKGLGGRGAVSDAAVHLCKERGVRVIEGACPMMFLEPVSWFHRVHRAARHVNRSLLRA